MRIEKRKGPFKTIDIFLEDLGLSEIQELKRRYQRVTVLTHKPLEVPPGFRLRQKKTPIIHLEQGAGAVLARFRDTFRNEVHRTERLSDFSVRLPDDNGGEAYKAYADFEYSQQRAPISRAEFCRFILAGAYYRGSLISGITFFRSGEKIRIRSIFSVRLSVKGAEDKELYKIIGFASKRLMFEICRRGIDEGAKSVDLASINLTDPAKEPIARFKSGFGAEIEDEYQYIYSSQIFKMAEMAAGIAVRVKVWLRKSGIR